MSAEIKGYTEADLRALPDISSPPQQEQNNKVTLITRSKLPHDVGYRFAFIPTENGVLKPTLQSPRKPAFIDYPTWAYTNGYREDGELFPFLHVSEHGLGLLEDIGMETVYERIKNPDLWEGEVIGEGSESLVRKIELAGRTCVVKTATTDEKTKNLLQRNQYMLRVNYTSANYLGNFGNQTQIGTMLQEGSSHFDTFTVDSPPTEYLAADTFSIEEYRESTNVGEIKTFIETDSTKNEKYLGFDRSHWQNWFERFEAERTKIEDIFFLVFYQQKDRFSIFKEVDLSYGNFLITDVDPSTGMPKLSLTDQNDDKAAPGAGAGWDIKDMEDDATYKKLLPIYQNDPFLHYLQGVAEKRKLASI